MRIVVIAFLLCWTSVSANDNARLLDKLLQAYPGHFNWDACTATFSDKEKILSIPCIVSIDEGENTKKYYWGEMQQDNERRGFFFFTKLNPNNNHNSKCLAILRISKDKDSHLTIPCLHGFKSGPHTIPFLDLNYQHSLLGWQAWLGGE